MSGKLNMSSKIVGKHAIFSYQIRSCRLPPHPKNPNFQLFPKSKSELTDYPPPPSQKSKFPTFFPKSKSEVADYPPSHPKNPNFQLFFLSPNPKLQITPPSQKSKFPTFFPKSKSEVADYPPSLGILYGFSICVTSSIFKYYSLFH